MRKVFTLAAFAAFAAGTMWADVKIGETSYETLQAAVEAANANDVLVVSGEIDAQYKNDRITIGQNLTIKGEDGALVHCTQRGKNLFLINQNVTFTVEIITFDGANNGTPRVWDTTAVVSCEKGTSNFTNVKFANFTITMKNSNDATNIEKNAIIGSKNAGSINLENVTFENCTVAEGFCMVTAKKNNGLKVTGNNPGLSIYLDNGVAFTAADLTNTEAINVQFAANRAAGNVVTGYTDASKFNFLGMTEGFGVEVDGTNLVYAKQSYVAMIGSTGYKALNDALNAANVALAEGQEPYTINLLEDADLTGRVLLAQNASINVVAAETKTISRGDWGGNHNHVTFEAAKNPTSISFKNIKFVSTGSVGGNLFTTQNNGTIILENIDASEFNTSAAQQVQLKENGIIYVTNSTLGVTKMANNTNLHLAGNNTLSIEFEGIQGSNKYPRIHADAEMTNTTPIAITGALEGYVGKPVISGEYADASKFTLPQGYEFTESEGSLILTALTPAAPELQVNQDTKQITVTAEEGATVWYKVTENSTASEAQAYVALYDAATEAEEEISEANGWTNSNEQVYSTTLENGKNYAFSTGRAGQFSPITGVSVSSEGVITGVENLEADNADAPVEYYNLQGIRVANPQGGIFIRRQGNKVTKIAL